MELFLDELTGGFLTYQLQVRCLCIQLLSDSNAANSRRNRCIRLFRLRSIISSFSPRHGSFSGCTQLVQINFPNHLDSIGKQANCFQLKQVILPNTLGEIGDRTFWGCNLSILRIPEKLVFPVFDYNKMTFVINSHGNIKALVSIPSTPSSSPAATTILATPRSQTLTTSTSSANHRRTSVKFWTKTDLLLEFEFEWTRSTVASWVRQKLVLPADQIKALKRRSTPRRSRRTRWSQHMRE